MPVSPDFAAGLAKDVLAIYSQAEETLLEKIASRLAKGITEPNWADAKLLEIQKLRAETEHVIADLAAGSNDAIERALRIGYNRGVASAGADLVAAGTSPGISFGRVNEHAVNALVKATQKRVDSTHLRIRRWATDVYTDVIRQSGSEVVTGILTRQQATSRALTTWAGRGVTGFVDEAGRNWSLGSYAEMAVRTSSAQAMVQGHVDKLIENGLDLVIVSNAPQECNLCRPWEGKVLSLKGSPDYPLMSDAVGKGLFHPNCRHSTSLYQPGITKAPTNTEDPQGDKDRQDLRTMERRVREWKRREAAALTPTDTLKAKGQVRAYQAKIRSHVSTTTAKRQPGRELLAKTERTPAKAQAYWRENAAYLRSASSKVKPTQAWGHRESARLLPTDASTADKERVASLLSQHPEKVVKKLESINLTPTEQAMQEASMQAGFSKSQAKNVSAFYYQSRITMKPGFDDITFHHEMGHHVEQSVAKSKMKNYADAYQTNNRFDRHTDYAKTSYGESFAESYAAFLGSGSPMRRVSDPHYEGTFAVLRKVLA